MSEDYGSLEDFLVTALHAIGLITGKIDYKNSVLHARIPNESIRELFEAEFRHWAEAAFGLEAKPKPINILNLEETVA